MKVLKFDVMEINSSEDVVLVRQSVRKTALSIGLGLVDQTKVVTASSELARNTLVYGGGGTVRIEVLDNDRRTGIRLIFEDHGPGIADLDLALTDGYTIRQRHGPWIERRKAPFARIRNFLEA